MDMSVTTLFMALIILTVWRKPVAFALAFYLVFALIE